MTNFKRLANINDRFVKVECPISAEEIVDRQLNYENMSAKDFLSKHRQLLFKPVEFSYKGKEFSIQYNHCTEPLCKWFGKEQEELIKKNPTQRRKSYRYRLSGTPDSSGRVIVCNPDPSIKGAIGGCYTTPISNWSVAEEIKRLVVVGSISDLETNYQFHKDSCSLPTSNPFENPEEFSKFGKSKTNSQRYKCKHCNKYTNVLPKREQSYSYHQKRNEILPKLASMLVNRVPVRRACEMLNIGSQTYYHKLEYIYMRCLEFLERYEVKPLSNMEFKTMWLDTDCFVYYLNNIRQKFAGGPKVTNKSFRKLQTQIVVSGDIHSRYIFRSDVAYDWDVTKIALEQETKIYKCDHLEDFERKNARLRYSYAPQPPTEFDKKNLDIYSKELNKYNQEKNHFDKRFNYVNGINTSTQYTAIAHLWLIKQMIQAKEWCCITDKDPSLVNSISRVFKDEISDGYANYFLCMVDREKKAGIALQEYNDCQKRLQEWRNNNPLYYEYSDYEVALNILTNTLRYHKFYDEITDDYGYKKIVNANRLIDHPLATPDQGYRKLNVLTDLSGLNAQQLAELLMKVNHRATDSFMQQIRRRLSVLERPLVTAREDKKSYIYANFNPKYAQYLVTILRTYYNFCLGIKSKDGVVKTPAQRLGIAKKQYKLEEIIYFK